MLRSILLSMVVLLAASPVASAKKPVGEAVWTGIDYGLVRCVGTMDFNNPAEIFPGYFEKWNALTIAEMLEPLTQAAAVAELRTDIQHLPALHAKADPTTQIIRDDGFSPDEALAEDVVRARIKSWTLAETTGTGIAMIADQLNKPREQGCYWFVKYDIASRETSYLMRHCAEPSGIGFRNYWFGSAKEVILEAQKALR